jgi:glycosyltransferase involved in cell wall biosynthesis
MSLSFLLGTAAYNMHVQQIGRALHEAGALAAYVTAGVDSYRNPVVRRARQLVGRQLPFVDRELRRRSVSELPPELIHTRWWWELPRVVAGRLRSVALEDWIWERAEFALDAHCARLLARDTFGAYFGVEHGALASLQAARRLNKPAVVAFLSPHHRTLEQWVGSEFDSHPELYSRGQARIATLAARRDARRDEELAEADWIVTGSSFTTRSLVDVGVPARKILTIPLGGPVPITPDRLPAARSKAVRFVYVGPVSVRKGAHYLLKAWSQVARPGVELHLYGKVLLPDRMIAEARASRGADQLFVHGSVPGRELPNVYLQSSVLVLPTLCDGFGQVISDALAHGLPVITTSNAGAADLVECGRCGFVIPPADAAALANTMQWCADRPDDLFAMRNIALGAAAKWTWFEFRRHFAELVLGAVGVAVANDRNEPVSPSWLPGLSASRL